jgi:hypothetical protein
MVERLVSNEAERIRKEAVAAKIHAVPEHLSGQTEESHKKISE